MLILLLLVLLRFEIVDLSKVEVTRNVSSDIIVSNNVSPITRRVIGLILESSIKDDKG